MVQMSWRSFHFDHLSHVYFRLYLSSLPSLIGLLCVFFLSHWRPGYNSECVRYMFPTVVGIVPDTMYCDCWQAKLAEMIGPYRRRHSRLVTFLDPEDVDVNFVPNDAWDEIHVLGGRFKYIFLFSPRKLGKWSNLTSIFFKWVGSTTN